MASPKDNMEQLEELFRQDGRGCLLIGYETGMDKPHAAISYQLYPVNPEQDGMTYQFLGLLHVGVETDRILAFVPDTRLEIYRFPRMSDVPSISRDIPVREYITDKLLPHIRRYGLEPVVSVNLRDAVFMRSALKRPMEPDGRLRLTAAEIDRLMDFRLLVRDDGSRVRLDRLPELPFPAELLPSHRHVGVLEAVNELYLQSSAPYLMFCDQDDVWKEEKIISAVKCIENIDKPALYSSAVEVVDKDLTFIRKSFTDNTFKNPLYDILTYGTPGCTFVFNKALMEKLKQYKPSVISMHDSWISFVCLAVNGFFYSDQNAYIMYRQHDANVLGAQRHSLKDTLMGIVKNKNVLRSDMAKEILKGYSEMMPEKTKEAFIAFAEYKENLKYKLKILMLPYNKKKTTKRTFEKVKLRVVFNTI